MATTTATRRLAAILAKLGLAIAPIDFRAEHLEKQRHRPSVPVRVLFFSNVR
jgi:hypothetical protein